MHDTIPATPTRLSAADLDRHMEALGALLRACVEDGASISFVLPFTQTEGEAFWRDKVRPGVAAGTRVLLAAWLGDRLAGTVQLVHDMPPNQPHRAEVSKLLVHPDCRRRGIARALMTDLERRAAALNRRLITLDTRTGDSAEPLYTALGYETAGIIPDWSVDPAEDRLDSTTFMYKRL